MDKHNVPSKPSQSSSRRVSTFKDSSVLLNNLRGELHKSEVLLIASTLLVVKAENIYRNTIKYAKRWKQSSAIKQLLETLFLAIKMYTDFPTDVIWINTMLLRRPITVFEM